MGTNPVYPVLVKKEATGQIDRPTHRTHVKIKVEMGLTAKVQESAKPSREAQKGAPTAAFESSH